MGDYRKIFPADWFRGEKSMQRNSWDKQYPALKKTLLMTYNVEKKSYSVMWGKKFLTPEVWRKNYYLKITHTPLLHLGPMVMLTIRGWRKKLIWHLSKCHPSTNGWRALIKWWFSRLKFCISRLKIRQRNTQMERESSMECSVSFLWTNESFSLWNCLSKKSTLFLHGG